MSIKVELLSYTPNAEELLYSAFKQCYSKDSAKNIFDNALSENTTKIEDFIKNVVSSGHESPLEHISFTFSIEGMSRNCSHQLVRHKQFCVA